MKNHAADMVELLKILNVPKVILFGHDWYYLLYLILASSSTNMWQNPRGGVVTSRIYLYHGEIVSHIANVCTPFLPPTRQYIPIRELVATKMPTFKYQIALQDPQTEKDTEAPGKVRQFLNGLHRGHGDESGEFQVDKDIVEKIGNPGRSKFMSEEDLDYFAKEFERNGFHGPLNWYKTRKANYEDEKEYSPSSCSRRYQLIRC